MGQNGRHDRGIETRDIASGFNAVFHRGDGTSVKVWGRTEGEAEQKLFERLRDRGVDSDDVEEVDDV